MQTYYISGAWFDTNNKITNVVLHCINPDGTFQFGVEANLSQVANALEHEKAVVKTILWNYTYASWEIGPEVIVNQDNFLEYTNKNPDRLKLANLIKMCALVNL